MAKEYNDKPAPIANLPPSENAGGIGVPSTTVPGVVPPPATYPTPSIGGFLKSLVPAAAAGFLKASSFLYGAPRVVNPFYRVASTDKSIPQVAASLGINPASIVAANYGMSGLPPSGSMIATGFTPSGGSRGGGGYASTTPKDDVIAAGGANYIPGVDTSGQTEAMKIATKLDTFMTQAALLPQGGDRSLLPSIPVAVQTSMWDGTANSPLTASNLTAMGYTLNGTTQTWIPPKPVGAPGYNPYPLNYFDAKARNGHGAYVTGHGGPRSGRGMGRWGGRGGTYDARPPAALPSPENAAAANQTVLALRLGSG